MWVCKEWDPKVIMGLLFSFAIFVVVVVVAFVFGLHLVVRYIVIGVKNLVVDWKMQAR
jgi:hypothetical protein